MPHGRNGSTASACPSPPATPSPARCWSGPGRRFPRLRSPTTSRQTCPRGAVVRHPVGRGEIIVRADLATGAGPAAGADRGDIVVPISDPLITNPSIGLDVAVYSDGLVLAADARIVHVETDVVFVAVALRTLRWWQLPHRNDGRRWRSWVRPDGWCAQRRLRCDSGANHSQRWHDTRTTGDTMSDDEQVDYEDLTDMRLDDDSLAELLDAGGECVFNWTTKDGHPVGVVVAFVYHDGKFFTTCAERRKRVPALRARPQSGIVINNRGKTATFKGESIVHAHGDPGFDELKRWFYAEVVTRRRATRRPVPPELQQVPRFAPSGDHRNRRPPRRRVRHRQVPGVHGAGDGRRQRRRLNVTPTRCARRWRSARGRRRRGRRGRSRTA